jgi:CxxC motif-containing protein (DUF1111 family)
MKISSFPAFALSVLASNFVVSHANAQLPVSLEMATELSWPTSLGNTYQLQSATGDSGPWTGVGSEQPGTGSTQTSLQLESGSPKSYRVLETIPGSIGRASVVINGGFEDGSGSSADNWTFGGSQPPVRTSSEAYAGSHSLRSVVLNAGASANTASAEQRLSDAGSSVVAGESYELSFRAKQVSSGVSYIQQYDLQWLNSSGGFVSSTGLVAFSGGSGTWAEVSNAGLVAPAGATDARIFFRFVTGAIAGGEGEVLIDEVALSTAGEPQPEQVNVLPPDRQTMLQASWDSTFGVEYQPRVSDDLADSEAWTPLAPSIVGDGGPQSVVVPLSASPVFIVVQYPDEVSLEVVPLFSASTVREPATTVETPTALITYVADRSRDRHARESQFMAYDHYLTWYWEERTIAIEIIDEVAKGGTDITVNYTTLTPLSAPEFRAFYRGQSTVAEYHFNLLAPKVGPNQYSATVTAKLPENRNLQIGDRMEIEISQFFLSPMHGRNNYYGTAILYIVGQGIVPWQGIGGNLDSYPIPEKGWLGGETTNHYQYSNEPDNVFKQMAGNIAPVSAQPFMLGRRSHHTDFGNGAHSEPGNPVYTEQIGKLGPKFIARSCVECHTNNGRSLPAAVGVPIVKSVVKVGSDASGTAHPVLGKAIQPQATSGQPESSVFISSYTNTNGQYGDGTSYSLRTPNYSFTGTTPEYFSVRAAQQLVGLGLLEAIPEATIVAMADPDDEDLNGISGRIQTVVDPVTGQTRLGRFTHKAAMARVGHQIAAALNNDMGVTTSVFPILDGESSSSAPELDDNDLDEMIRYVALLGVSARSDLEDTEALLGESLFNSAGCADCHTPELDTGPYHPMAELRDQTIRPFTDLLLHDMGPGLADNMGEANASGAEWRTAPLWSIGRTVGVSGGESYLHDGRARTLEEAILWHGGEGETSKEAFRNMTSSERAALVKFLKSL